MVDSSRLIFIFFIKLVALVLFCFYSPLKNLELFRQLQDLDFLLYTHYDLEGYELEGSVLKKSLLDRVTSVKFDKSKGLPYWIINFKGYYWVFPAIRLLVPENYSLNLSKITSNLLILQRSIMFSYFSRLVTTIVHSDLPKLRTFSTQNW